MGKSFDFLEWFSIRLTIDRLDCINLPEMLIQYFRHQKICLDGYQIIQN